MKIICIGRNYVAHAKELGNDVPSEPLFFLKPDSALLQKGNPFYIPGFSQDVHHELELVIRINRLGKNIDEKFAHRYYDQVGIGIDFTARDLQQQCKEKGLPWEKAKAFDGSAPMSAFKTLNNLGGLHQLNYELKINGETVQQGDPSLMIFHPDVLIAHVSKFMTLKIGDLLFTGTPKGVGPVAPGDHLEGFLNGEKLLDLKVK